MDFSSVWKLKRLPRAYRRGVRREAKRHAALGKTPVNFGKPLKYGKASHLESGVSPVPRQPPHSTTQSDFGQKTFSAPALALSFSRASQVR
jgi:hypothetical protein